MSNIYLSLKRHDFNGGEWRYKWNTVFCCLSVDIKFWINHLSNSIFSKYVSYWGHKICILLRTQFQSKDKPNLVVAFCSIFVNATIVNQNWKFDVESFLGKVQRCAKKWSLGCESFLPGPAWLLLNKTDLIFDPSLYRDGPKLRALGCKNISKALFGCCLAKQVHFLAHIWTCYFANALFCGPW